MKVSVITPTYRRPQQLLNTCVAVKQQHKAGLWLDHWIVSDGPDPMAEYVAHQFQAKFAVCPRDKNTYGATCRNLITPEVLKAGAEFLLYWDDDNTFLPHAVSTVVSACKGNDIGVARAVLTNKQGAKPLGDKLERNFVDTMNFGVSREVAENVRWEEETDCHLNDILFLNACKEWKPNLKVGFSPVIIGYHIASRFQQ